MDDMIDDDIKNKRKKIARRMLMLHGQFQSPQLRESDPTFWILKGVAGTRAASPVSAAACHCMQPEARGQGNEKKKKKNSVSCEGKRVTCSAAGRKIRQLHAPQLTAALPLPPLQPPLLRTRADAQRHRA